MVCLISELKRYNHSTLHEWTNYMLGCCLQINLPMFTTLSLFSCLDTFYCLPGAPHALLQSCLTFGAFSFIMEGLNKQQTALAKSFASGNGGVDSPKNVLPPFTLPLLPPSVMEGFSSFCRCLSKPKSSISWWSLQNTRKLNLLLFSFLLLYGSKSCLCKIQLGIELLQPIAFCTAIQRMNSRSLLYMSSVIPDFSLPFWVMVFAGLSSESCCYTGGNLLIQHGKV